jgi:apolipoprotein N-acyltransferase
MLLAGGVSALGFEPLNLWPLTIVAMALLVDRLAGATRLRDALLCGWMFGVGHFLIGNNWVATAFTYQAHMPVWYGWVAVVLMALYLAVYPALAAVLAWRASNRQPLAFVFWFSAAWMLGEFLRGWVFTGYAWNPLGAAWLAVPWLAQGASGVGAYGLSALLVLLAGLAWWGFQRRWRTTLIVAVLLGVIATLPWTSPGASPPLTTIPIRIVQPNIGQDEKYDAALGMKHAIQYATLTGPPGTPRLVLWPETATLRFLELEPQARAELAALLGPGDILITGADSATLDLHGHNDVYRNSVFALDSTNTLRWRYDKAHLVPFGEYLPGRSMLERLGLARLVPSEGDFTGGLGPRTLPLAGFSWRGAPVTVGVQICYEIAFPGRVIDEAHRPTFLFNPSNDAWFGAWGPPQQVAQARLRAIEEGIAVIRATPNGISAVISPTGELLATLGRARAGVIDSFIPEPKPPTVFSRMGFWVYVLVGLGLCVAGWAARSAIE